MAQPKRNRFVDEYLIDLNATQAAIRSGYSAKTAGQQGERLLKNAEIQAALSDRMKKREQRTEITQDRVLREYAKLAFFDPQKLFGDDGRPLPISELEPDTAAAITGIDVATIGNAEMGVGEILKIRISDKKGALDSVARHLGMFNDKLNLNVNDALSERLARARKRG